jgi:hypothetical protein
LQNLALNKMQACSTKTQVLWGTITKFC